MKQCQWTGCSPENCGAVVIPTVNKRGGTIIQNETKWVEGFSEKPIRKHILRADYKLHGGGRYCYYHKKVVAGLLEPVLLEERHHLSMTRHITAILNKPVDT